MIVTYTECRGCRRKGSYAEDDRGQRVLWNRTFWCGCRGNKRESSTVTPYKILGKLSDILHLNNGITSSRDKLSPPEMFL